MDEIQYEQKQGKGALLERAEKLRQMHAQDRLKSLDPVKEQQPLVQKMKDEREKRMN